VTEVVDHWPERCRCGHLFGDGARTRLVRRLDTRWRGYPPLAVAIRKALQVGYAWCEVGLRVVIADDHALVRDGIVSLLATTSDIEAAGMATDLPQLLEVVENVNPDAVVTDIRMPPSHTTEGIQAAATIRERHPDIGVVVLSQYAEPEYIRALLGDGTSGRAYLLKSRVRDVGELAGAIRAVARGGSVVDPSIVDVLLSTDNASKPSELDELTEREREVLAEMAAGRSNASISERLYLSPKTVEKHVRAIFAKLGIAEEASVNRRVVAVVAWLERRR
jgi:DNA-binding NarL/FixJ family response regulator